MSDIYRGFSESGTEEYLDGAVRFLREHARCAGKLDEYARKTLTADIEELKECICEGGGTYSMDVRQWLRTASSDTAVGGRGPRPGCVFVSGISGGGHSGRRHTFIVGLDDGRFPGTGGQDPLVLDGERKELSEGIPTAHSRLSIRMHRFRGLIARLRGRICYSFCCRDLEDDREMFPSPVLLTAYRELSGDTSGNHEDMMVWLPDPVSFAPADEGQCMDMGEWWLWRMCGSSAVKDSVSVVETHFPDLERGAEALRQRQSDLFTEYDGFVPEAGRDMNPSNGESRPLSASALEKLARCPLWFFFEYALGIKPPDERLEDDAVWLDPGQKGGLLHSVFREFMAEVAGQNRIPEFPRDRELIMNILGRHVEEKKTECPPPGPDVLRREYTEMKQSAGIFLQREAEFCVNSRPEYFEVSVGLKPEGDGTPLDSSDPLTVALPGGVKMRLVGRIDRIDQPEPGSYSVWDYKTGKARDCRHDDPFNGGRSMQGIVYYLLAENRLKAGVSEQAKVSEFGYFYPNAREHGDRVSWPASEMVQGTDILALMHKMIADGCFPLSDKASDMNYGDYEPLLDQDPGDAAASTEGKMENTGNSAMAAFRILRGKA